MGQIFYLLNTPLFQRAGLDGGRDHRQSLWCSSPSACCIALQLLFTYAPVMNLLFETAPLDALGLGEMHRGSGIVVFVLVEAEKALARAGKHPLRPRFQPAGGKQRESGGMMSGLKSGSIRYGRGHTDTAPRPCAGLGRALFDGYSRRIPSGRAGIRTSTRITAPIVDGKPRYDGVRGLPRPRAANQPAAGAARRMSRARRRSAGWAIPRMSSSTAGFRGESRRTLIPARGPA